MKDYIKSKQQGGLLDMSDLKNKLLGNTTSKQDNIPAKQAKKLQVPVKDYITGQDVTAADVKNGTAHPMLASKQMTNYGTITAGGIQNSLREKLLNGLDAVDNNGKNMVAEIATQPIRAGARLLRPDKYFDGVRSDADIPAALGKLGVDAATVAPIFGGAGKLLRYVPGGNPVHAAETAQWLYNIGDEDAAFAHSYDPRTVGERMIDGVSNSKYYKGKEVLVPGTGVKDDWGNVTGGTYKRTGISGMLNDSPLGQLRKNYIANKYVYDAPMTAENIDSFAQSTKPLMRGNGMVVDKGLLRPDQLRKLGNSEFGDSNLAQTLKQRLRPTENPMEQFADPNSYTLRNDFTNNPRGDSFFAANLNPNQRSITNYSYAADFNQKPWLKKEVGAFTKNLEENGPDFYKYDPGSLSGDSFTTWTAGTRRNAKNYIPVNGTGEVHTFGALQEFNSMGSNSGLSKELLDGNRQAATLRARGMNDKNLRALGVPDDTREALMNYYDTHGKPAYFNTPVMKVPEGYVAPEGTTPNWLKLKETAELKKNTLINSRGGYNPNTHIDDMIDEEDAGEFGRYDVPMRHSFEIPFINEDGMILQSRGRDVNYDADLNHHYQETYQHMKPQYDRLDNPNNTHISRRQATVGDLFGIRRRITPESMEDPTTGLSTLDDRLREGIATQPGGQLLNDRITSYRTSTANQTPQLRNAVDFERQINEIHRTDNTARTELENSISSSRILNDRERTGLLNMLRTRSNASNWARDGDDLPW